MKKYLYSGALALAAILTLSACAKPKLDAKLSVNDIVYMSGSDLKLKDCLLYTSVTRNSRVISPNFFLLFSHDF